MMNALTLDQFDDYFQQLHHRGCYPWQRRLAERAVRGNWPGAIDLPTGSGKTACLDIAIFALACQASLPVEQQTAPRRIFFCVNRRVIVDEAHQRARRIATAIWRAERNKTDDKPVLRDVAMALRKVAGTESGGDIPPLDVLELRGGIYRDNRWARSITQPTIVCTTIDQLGSRLLFRGYGVSPNAAPIQAALIAYDSLILLDEAHISEPFRQTLDHVQRYLDPEKWAERSIGIRPVTVVPMTATPNDAMRKKGVIQLEADDRDQKLPLLQRLIALKPAELLQTNDVAKGAVEAAIKLAGDRPTAVGIIVNRVATARRIYESLCELQLQQGKKKQKCPGDSTIELVIGSMRPIDRDKQAKRLRTLVGADRLPVTTTTSFIVATQCIEVGADYDFDVLITECASLDALRQRFGRLNRAGRKDSEGKAIDAKALVLANKKDIKPDDNIDDYKPLDPIYGNALARTWNWLNERATEDVVDFGIDAFTALLEAHDEHGRPPQNLLAPSASLNSPVMLPAYVDFWCQTAPKPVPDPDVSLFIHGPQGSEPDVQVCWRADLVEDDHMNRGQWCDVVSLLPPTSAECMSVPISRLRRWLADEMDDTKDHGDVLGVPEEDEQTKARNGDRAPSLKHLGVLWRGIKDSKLISSPTDLRTGDTLVLPTTTPNSNLLGHVQPDSISHPDFDGIQDIADTAFARARDRGVLRLHPSLRLQLSGNGAFDALFTAASERENPPTLGEWSQLCKTAANALADDAGDLKHTLEYLHKGVRIDRYPDERGVVLTTRRRLGSSTAWFIPSMDDGDDDLSRTRRDKPVLLDDHTKHVLDSFTAAMRQLSLAIPVEQFKQAVEWHDLGKADERFQAMLRCSSRSDAYLSWGQHAALWAKSPGKSSTYFEYKQDCERAGLPLGFRHEMLSVQLSEHHTDLPAEPNARDLILHLIAAHHGYARPFAPVVPDEELPAVELDGIKLTHEERVELIPPHRLDSGVAERFWLLTRRFGWWGLAYLEAVLRLADQQASAAEDAGAYDDEPADQLAETTT